MTGNNTPSKNVYKKPGLDFLAELNFHGSTILFMGKRLSELSTEAEVVLPLKNHSEDFFSLSILDLPFVKMPC